MKHKATFSVKNYPASSYTERITWTCSCGKAGGVSDGAQGCTMARARRSHARHTHA